MNKKGLAPATLVALVIAIAVIIGVGIFLAQKSGEVKAEGFNLGYGKIPEKTPSLTGGGSPGGTGQPTIPAIATEFINAIEQATAEGTPDICRVELRAYFENNINIMMVKAGNNLRLMVQTGNEIPDEEATFENYAPCVVDGDNFRKLLMTGTKVDPQYMDLSSVAIIEDDKMTIEMAGETTDAKLFKENPLIYKAGTGHICLIPTFNDFWNSDCSDRGSNDEHYVDNDCIRKGVIEGYGHIPIC